MDTNQQTILIVDDDKNILMILEMYLKKEGFHVITCENGIDAVRVFSEENPSLVLLDVMLPGMDGFEVLAEIRKKSEVPIIMLTARGSTTDRIQGLEQGADDYVAKPFDSKELVARIKAVLRRSASSDTDQSETNEASFRGLHISMDNYLVTIDGNKIEMTPKEIELLFFLLVHAPNVFTREQLLENVWELEFYGDTRTVDVHVKRIREKLGAEYAAYITTVWAVGYKFDITKD
ncbi:MAG: response regulator transcription factor [Clostridia bacterium]|nr:response regulator transcription factor [Clostridia bacterium]